MSSIKQKVASCCAAVPSSMAALGSSWQLCHNLCLGAISTLASIGIIVTGMPLMFLNKYQFQFWLVAVALLAITLFLFFYKNFGSKHLLLVNFGIVFAGVPVKSSNWVFWLIGGTIILVSIILIFKSKTNPPSL